MSKNHFGLVIHGGAGTMDRSTVTPEREQAYRAALEQSLKAGFAILQRGGSSLDAVEAAVRVLEDDPLFNAGRGAVFTSAGIHELDASIMDGKTLKAGAVMSVQHIKNPISLARLIMEKSSSVALDGAGAEAFAKENGVELVDQKYFFTQERWDAWQRARKAAKSGGNGEKKFIVSDQDRHGTVGAVALDQAGNLAAATSTGGMTDKRPGRVGDSPIIGAGTYARDGICAISGTGQGEAFIRRAAAYDVTARMMYANATLDQATQALIFDTMAGHAVGAGVVAIDSHGQVLAPFNTLGMYRGWIMADGRIIVATHTEQHVMGQVKTHA